MRLLRELCKAEERAGELLERYQTVAGVLLLGFVVMAGLGLSAHRAFSYDEQITWRTARMPVGELWSFFAQGLDTTGPVQSLVAHAALRLPESPEVAVRVPFLAAFAVMCWGLWSFVRRRYAAGFALAVLVLPLEFATLAYFRTDARAYALMLCATGAGIRFWQMAAEGRARPWSVIGLWLVLAVGMSAHFFTVFVAVPLGIAQMVQERTRGRVDWAVWGALVLFPLGWLAVAPGEMRAHALYAGSFWSKPTLANLGDAYEQMITPNWWVIAVLGLFVLGVVLARRWVGREGQTVRGAEWAMQGFSRAEWVLVLGLLALPLVAWCGGKVTGAFHHYYAAPFAAGLMVAIAAVAAELSGRRRGVGVMFLMMVLGLLLAGGDLRDAMDGLAALRDRGDAHRDIAKSVQALDWVSWVDGSGLAVAADNATYARLLLYSGAGLAGRSYALTDESLTDESLTDESLTGGVKAERFPRAVTDQINMRLFGARLGFQWEEIERFRREHPRFLLVQPRPTHSYEWMGRYLTEPRVQADGTRVWVRFYSRDEEMIVLEVCSGAAC